MYGENNGKTYEQMDDLGVLYPYFLETPRWRFYKQTFLAVVTAGGSSAEMEEGMKSGTWDLGFLPTNKVPSLLPKKIQTNFQV